ncbi:hypothetical protein ANN_16011 [Periplaneta americana]|uniref:Uncharacterized protein n=1 Tax=Periplaneta americana TaxID=6978 RepID=A0ABQ8SIU3_PERAM|nr:hypothetical protein ANN_16011 [Periplaneta americana]
MNVAQVQSAGISGAIGVHRHQVTIAVNTGTAITVGMGVVTLIADTETWPNTAVAPIRRVSGMEADWSQPDHHQLGLYCEPPQQLYCHQPQHQLLQQQMCELSQSAPPPPPPQPQMTLVQSSWWPVVDLPNGAASRLPWTWIPCMESTVEAGRDTEPEPEIEPDPDPEPEVVGMILSILGTGFWQWDERAYVQSTCRDSTAVNLNNPFPCRLLAIQVISTIRGGLDTMLPMKNHLLS